MISSWVLIIFLSSGWASSGHTIEYTSRESCLQAIEHLERSKAATRVQAAVCIPKG